MNIGIVGAGFIGQAMSRLLLAKGYRVMIANSRGPETLRALQPELEGLETGTVEQACRFADLLLLAIPFSHYGQLPVAVFDGKVVMDAGNYYPQRDGRELDLDAHRTTTSERLAAHLTGATIVKAVNAILASDIVADARPPDANDRRALPIAGDDSNAKARVSQLLETLGYDVVDVGSLSEGWRFERARPAYCIPLHAQTLARTLAATERYVTLPDTRWNDG
ncbi:NADPH-dependent F420 reductase [Salinicola aestuarinus]|uniref:NADPH-dependent F420 reductase n=1 Tax=Salinicola aestuarinus TaxID=1949082 RepID=UPI000DA2457E|nr:NAD(P)-binding domain-containing protein [Salinicola aestuarinus]